MLRKTRWARLTEWSFFCHSFLMLWIMLRKKSRKPEGNRLTFILSSTGVRKGNITEKERKFPSWLTGCSSAKRAAVGCVLQGTAGEWAGSG